MGKKVLTVDDEPHIRLLIEQTLEEFEDEGVEILSASNGPEALGIIKAEKPDLVFLDIMMPGMSGFDVCRTVKHDLGMDNVYIVLLTAKGQDTDREKGREAGADLYMTKPFNPDEIIAKTAEVLGIKT